MELFLSCMIAPAASASRRRASFVAAASVFAHVELASSSVGSLNGYMAGLLQLACIVFGTHTEQNVLLSEVRFTGCIQS